MNRVWSVVVATSVVGSRRTREEVREEIARANDEAYRRAISFFDGVWKMVRRSGRRKPVGVSTHTPWSELEDRNDF